VVERAIQRDALPERERKKSEKALELPKPKPKSAPKPKLVLPTQWFVDKVLAHRVKNGQLEFRVQWKGVPADYYKNKWFFPLDPTFRTGNVLDKKVGAYMKANAL
jgi:hypothetical protein